MTKINEKNFKIALKDSFGIQILIAKRLNVDRSTIVDYLERHPQFRKDLDLEKEKIVDKAESVLFQKISDNDLDSSKWVLSRLGKNRGYSEKHEIEGQTTLTFNWNDFLKKVEIENNDKLIKNN